MLKRELMKELHKKYPGISYKRLAGILADYEENIRVTLLSGKTFCILNTFSLKPVLRGSRRGRNPQTGAIINIPAWKTARLRISKRFREDLNK